jgi:predicted membrane protein (TIGR00267 family)
VRLRINRARLLPHVLGFVDGTLTSLTLASATILNHSTGITAGLALRIGLFALSTSGFVLFVARYTELRGELVRAERELNLLSHGKMATTALGRAVRLEATTDAIASSIASFTGALVPLLFAVAFPTQSWIAILVALLMLATLGLGVARAIHGNAIAWALSLATGGLILTLVGLKLHIT